MLIRELAWQDPAGAFAALAGDPHLAWFDSQGPVCGRARFSMLALDPFQTIATEAGRTLVDGVPLEGDPLGILAACMSPHATAPLPHAIPFTGGAAGFLGYEFAARLEPVPRLCAGVPDMVMGLYDLVLGFDRAERRCWLFSSGLPEPAGPARENRARWRADIVQHRLGHEAPPRLAPRLAWRRETSRHEHMARIGRTLDYIRAGDIYQANITARFTADLPPGVTGADLHLALRAKSPAPFGAFLSCGARLSVASVSPERFISLSASGDIETRPIKGTRPRGRTAEQDAAFRSELEGSVKDRAENLMIVDLLRHDIGRVAAFGSVRVPEFCALETFPHVHHLVSTVRGTLRPELGAIDLLRACFPGGSITGAPKIRAMQIIGELEHSARGPYCGSVAWLGWDGAMDSSIAIRTLVVTPETVALQAGGGIVADSDPAEEFFEMMAKAGPLLSVFGDIPP